MRLPALKDDYGYMSGFALAVVIVVGMALLMGAIATGDYFVSKRNCNYAARQFHRDTRYDFSAGCFVQTDTGAYVPLKAYRAVER